jgi:hypothetical protein
MHSDVSKRDIQEECIFAWSGKDLVLLPVNSEDYQKALSHTKKQAKNISVKDLKVGYQYSCKSSEDVYIYMGRYDYYDINIWRCSLQEYKGKRHIFYKRDKDEDSWDMQSYASNVQNKLAECISDEPDREFQKLLNGFLNSKHHLQIIDIITEPCKTSIIEESIWGRKSVRYIEANDVCQLKGVQIIQWLECYDINRFYEGRSKGYYKNSISGMIENHTTNRDYHYRVPLEQVLENAKPVKAYFKLSNGELEEITTI